MRKMASPQVQHDGLNATFTGIETQCDGTAVHHFRGIKYASIPGRFERAQPVTGFDGRIVDSSRFGYITLYFLPNQRLEFGLILFIF